MPKPLGRTGNEFSGYAMKHRQILQKKGRICLKGHAMTFPKVWLAPERQRLGTSNIRNYRSQEVNELTIFVALVSDTQPSLSSMIASSAPALLPSICTRGETAVNYSQVDGCTQIIVQQCSKDKKQLQFLRKCRPSQNQSCLCIFTQYNDHNVKLSRSTYHSATKP